MKEIFSDNTINKMFTSNIWCSFEEGNSVFLWHPREHLSGNKNRIQFIYLVMSRFSFSSTISRNVRVDLYGRPQLANHIHSDFAKFILMGVNN